MKQKMAQMVRVVCVWRHRKWSGHVPDPPSQLPTFQSNGPEAVRAAFLLLTLPDGIYQIHSITYSYGLRGND